MNGIYTQFKTVIETGNITKAAEKLNISQPALTMKLKTLEKQLGVELLIRSKSGVLPTKAGDILYEYSKNISVSSKNLRIKLEELKNTYQSTLKIGMIDNVGLTFTSHIYKSFLNQFPNLELNLFIDNTTRLMNMVEDDKLDFAIIASPSKKHSKLINIRPFAKENLYLVGTQRFVKKFSKNDKSQQIEFIAYNKEAHTHKMISQELEINNIRVKYIAYSTSPQAMLALVEQGLGAAVLPENILKESLIRKKIFRIDLTGANFERRLSIVHSNKHYLGRTTLEFIDQLKDFYLKQPYLLPGQK